MSDDNRRLSDKEIETLFDGNLEGSPPDDVVRNVNPLKNAVSMFLWGLTLTTITLNVWVFDHILQLIGTIAFILSFRILRHENRSFSVGFITSIAYSVVKVIVLTINATVLRVEILASPVGTVLTVISLVLKAGMLVSIFVGFCMLRKKAGSNIPLGSIIAMIVWYIMLYMFAYLEVEWYLVLGLVAAFFIIVARINKMAGIFVKEGYTVKRKPVRLNDFLVTVMVFAFVIVGVASGYVFSHSYPMEWQEAIVSHHADVVRIKEELLGLGFPDYVLNDLTDEEILSCDGAVSVVYDAKPALDNQLLLTEVAVALQRELRNVKLFHHFIWKESPEFFGTECIKLYPAYAGSMHHWRCSDEASGRVLCNNGGKVYAADFYSFANDVHVSNGSFQGFLQQYSLYANFSFNKDGENHRAYVCYTMEEIKYGALVSSNVDYVHQKRLSPYPVSSAAGCTSFSANGIFRESCCSKTWSQIMFSYEKDGTMDFR